MSSELTVVKDAMHVQRAALAIVAAPNTPLHLCPSTLPRDADGIKRRFNAMGQSDLEMGRDGTLLMEVCDVLAVWREGTNPDTGEISEFSWLILIGTDGKTFGTSSSIVAEKVGQMVALWSAGLIDRPTGIQIVTRKSKRGPNHYHDILMA